MARDLATVLAYRVKVTEVDPVGDRHGLVSRKSVVLDQPISHSTTDTDRLGEETLREPLHPHVGNQVPRPPSHQASDRSPQPAANRSCRNGLGDQLFDCNEPTRSRKSSGHIGWQGKRIHRPLHEYSDQWSQL